MLYEIETYGLFCSPWIFLSIYMKFKLVSTFVPNKEGQFREKRLFENSPQQKQTAVTRKLINSPTRNGDIPTPNEQVNTMNDTQG